MQGIKRMNEEPNAALLMAFAGVKKPDDKHERLVKERQDTIDAMKVLNNAREREIKRIEGIQKARRKRNGT